MIFVYLLAFIGLFLLLGLAALAVLGVARHLGDDEPEDSFGLALAAVARLQSAAWRSIQELRELDSRRKG
jgi:hypothetical protein